MPFPLHMHCNAKFTHACFARGDALLQLVPSCLPCLPLIIYHLAPFSLEAVRPPCESLLLRCTLANSSPLSCQLSFYELPNKLRYASCARHLHELSRISILNHRLPLSVSLSLPLRPALTIKTKAAVVTCGHTKHTDSGTEVASCARLIALF